ncbi:MAG: COR domain-containing protein [Chloroflexota bacterium]
MTRNKAHYEAEEIIEEALRSGTKELTLTHMGFTGVLDLLDQLPHLESLDLSHNQLMLLPESLGKLTLLQSLDLSVNNLDELPTWLSKLTQLRTLNLRSNNLTEVPEWIGNLTQLQSLDLSQNNLITLPESLRHLTELISLNLSSNNLVEVPQWFEDFTQLQTLDLSGNETTSLPETLGQLIQLQSLDFSNNQLTISPEWLGQLTLLKTLKLQGNRLTALPESLGLLTNLVELRIDENQIEKIPESQGSPKNLILITIDSFLGEIPHFIRNLKNLHAIGISKSGLISLPEWIEELSKLQELSVLENYLTDLPLSLVRLKHLKRLDIKNNPLNPELAEAYKQGLKAVKVYLRAKAKAQITLNEAKLIIIGEGEVGKTCLMDALLGKEWQEHPSTHGIEIQQIKVTDSETKKEITLNGWDFGGQRVYRPTHQLFFSAPAVYLVVWKPREGPQQGFVKEWIQLVKRREPSAKIIVVATHGGPQQRQPDIDRQELWDTFGKETVVDFFFVDSKPDAQGNRKGLEELKNAIARVAATLPEVGRSVPKSFADVRAALQATGAPYLPFDEVLAICRTHNMDDEIARLFITISHRLGHLTHYENDPALRDIVILRPDWLASAMSYVLDDEATRSAHGLVDFSRLNHLWDDPTRPADTRYPATLHRIFLRLMERFDLSYRVAGLSPNEDSNPVSLIAQLVPDTTPKEDDFTKAWASELATGDIQQTQICRIVDAQNGQSANAEGLFYQLIVRLHRYSLGRIHYPESVHWQRGLILDADYNGRGLLRHIGNDVHITVRAAFPEYFLGVLTSEVRYLVESFWEGLRCDVTVPCLNPKPCLGLMEVQKLIESKQKGRHEYPCPVCNEWQDINTLLRNAPAATEAISLNTLARDFAQVKDTLNEVNGNTRRILSQVDKQYADFIQLFTDEAKEGPRLFSLFPLDGNKFNPQTWMRSKFRLVLWCEHSRLPLPVHNNWDMKKGVYDLEFDREWFKRAVPYLKFLTGTLSLVLPVMSSTFKVVNDTAFKTFENQLGLGKNVIDSIAGEGALLKDVMGTTDSTNLYQGVGARAENATLRELHALLKAKDPSFGGLVRVMNKRQEFLWVHERFAGEY